MSMYTVLKTGFICRNLKEEKSNDERLDDEYKKLQDAITTGLVQQREAINYTMKISK